jgi:predicted house-cleaning noncanonical NTP pyrophosphatase (MazG superfamily)
MLSEEEIDYFNPIIREIDSDNSCLFNSIGYLQDKSSFNENTSQNLRNIIANYIKNNPEKYNQTFLNMENEEYQNFITNKNNWGGAIEIKILSEILQIEICTFDIENLQTLFFGENENYSEIIFLMYDGIHYNSLVLLPDGCQDFDFDITKFPINMKNKLTNKFFEIIKKMNTQNQFVNLNQMILVCDDCKDIFQNQEEALKHQQNCGHKNFSQI